MAPIAVDLNAPMHTGGWNGAKSFGFPPRAVRCRVRRIGVSKAAIA